MRKFALFATVVAVLFCLSGLPLMAQGRGQSEGGMSGGPGMGGNPAMGGGPMMGQGQGMGQNRGMGNGPMMGRDTGMENGRTGRRQDGANNGPMMGQQKTPDQLLAQNTKLSSKLRPLLPAGTNLQDAAAGFKNLGQFVAALHVSHNLNIPFDQFKTKMIAGDSLGKAVQELNPNLSHKDRKAAVKKGKKEAKSDIKSSS